MTTKTKVHVLNDLQQAEDGSYYTIRGAGGDLSEWVTGLTKVLKEEGIGTPTAWYTTTGRAVNEYARPTSPFDAFQDDLVFLLFPLDGLDVGRLALFRIRAGDVWFDDMVQNMR